MSIGFVKFASSMTAVIVAIAAAGIVAVHGASAQGVYAYPNKGQSQAQQNQDRSECHSWAVSQSGFDPAQAQGPAPPPEGQVVRGAAGGAAIGAIGGAIGGNAGKGAAIGAVSGALIGGIRKRRAQQDYQNQASAVAAQQGSYNRALSACLQGRGYTVN
jgi:YmgG-like glycine-zipper protein